MSTSRNVPPPTPVICAQDHRLCGTDPEVQGLAGPGDGEHAEPDGVEHRDCSGEPVQAVAKEEGDEGASGGHRQISPVLEGGRRQVVQQDVADDAPAQRSDHAEGDDADDVQPDSAHRGQCSVEAERKCPGQIEDKQPGRSGAHLEPFARWRIPPTLVSTSEWLGRPAPRRANHLCNSSTRFVTDQRQPVETAGVRR